MRVVDSSLWVEYLADGPMADQAETCIEPLSTCVVPTLVLYELTKWSHRKFGIEKAQAVLSLLTECNIETMDASIAAEAAILSLRHKLHATDAIIYATAQLMGAKLYTCDEHFKDLPDVEYCSKSE
jgi:predicted nucleic acid-binding protein